MQKNKRFSWIAGFILLSVLFIVFRLQLINWVQQQVLSSFDQSARVSNEGFASTNDAYSHHGIYALRGRDRIWPHRVNSLKRLEYLYPEFAGFECDIRYDNLQHKFFVAHDSIEINALTFVDYLRDDPLRKLFWLDIKNLSDVNRYEFSKQLQQLDHQFSLRNRIILESSDTASLIYLSGIGFLTSYYLPALDITDSTNRRMEIDGITIFLKKHPMLISQDIRMHDFMQKHFPGQKQLTWDLAFTHSLSYKVLLHHINDTNLLICLINVKSPGYQ